MIEIKKLSVDKKRKTICTVAELSIEPFERIAILGPNGSGKTTLLRVLAGLESEYQGACSIDIPHKKRGYVHQSPYLLRGSLLFNVMYGLRADGLSRAESHRIATRWLSLFQLQKLADQRVTHLSGGEKRRVALARAMARQPQLLLLDEPLADLDAEGQTAFCEAVLELKACTIFMASPTKLPAGLTNIEYQMRIE